MIALLFFVIDYCAYVWLGKWVVFSLLTYFTINLVRSRFTYSIGVFYLPLFLLLLEGFLRDGRFGLSLVYLLPIMLFAARWRSVLLNATSFLPFVLTATAIIVENTAIMLVLEVPMSSFSVTIMKIFVNLILGSIILLGTRGNRSLPIYR